MKISSRRARSVFRAAAISLIAAAVAWALLYAGQARSAVSAPGDMIAQARQAYNDRAFADAAADYKLYLDTYPDGPDRDEAGFFYAQCLFLTRDLTGSAKAFAQEERKNKTYADQVLFYEGEIATLRREFTDALVFFDRLLGEYPASMMAGKARERLSTLHYDMGNEYLGQGAFSMALQNYLQTADAPADLKPLVQYHLGRAYVEVGDFDKAVQTWGDLSLAEGQTVEDAALLARYRLARLLEDRASYDEAEVNYQALITAAPKHLLAPLARDGLARVWAKEGKTDQAAAYWKKQSGGNNLIAASAKYGDALAHYLHEEYGDAETALLPLAGQDSDHELAYKARLLLARVYTGQGRKDKMDAAWQAVVSDDMATNLVRLECGEAMLDLDPDLAAKSASAALDAGAGALEEKARGILALARLRSGGQKGRDDADKYLAKYPGGAYAGELFGLRGRRLLADGKAKDAESDLLKAASLGPGPDGRIAAYIELAGLYRASGRMDSALKMIAKARDQAKTAPTALQKLEREGAEIAYARGDYAAGIAVYDALCGDTAHDASCAPADRFRLFWGLYRAGKKDESAAALGKVEAAGGEWAFQAGFWRGQVMLEGGDTTSAMTAWRALKPVNQLDSALLAWQIAMAQDKAGEFAAARQTLAAIDQSAPDAGLYTRGKLLALALDAGDFASYMASLPDPAAVDEQTLSEDALLSALKKKAAAGASQADLAALNRVLQVQAVNERNAEAGDLIVAKAGLNGPGRAAALAMLDRVLAQDPGTPLAGEIKLYKGEDAFFKKDYQAAASWLKDVKPVDVPPELRFRLLYLQGQSCKQMRDIEAMRPFFLALVAGYQDHGKAAREWLDVGIGLTLTTDFSAAKTAIGLAIAQGQDPKLLAEANYWKGMIEEGTGDLDSALATFLAVDKNYRDQVMWATTALYEAAEVCMQKQDYDQALTYYQRVLDRSQGDRAVTDKVKAKMAQARKLKQLNNPILKKLIPR